MWGSVSTPCSFKLYTMKIEKLYTLSQFVDFIKTEDAAYSFSEGNLNYMFPEHQFDCIDKYNNFLKQPLKKEMFVNDILCPDAQDYNTESEYETDLKAWQEAENKVIFKGWTKVISGTICNHDYPEIEISESMRISIKFGDSFRLYKSLHELAEETNGELQLQNLEL